MASLSSGTSKTEEAVIDRCPGRTGLHDDDIAAAAGNTGEAAAVIPVTAVPQNYILDGGFHLSSAASVKPKKACALGRTELSGR